MGVLHPAGNGATTPEILTPRFRAPGSFAAATAFASLGFTEPCALFVDDARGDFLFTSAIPAGPLKFSFQFFVYPFAFWTGASWHKFFFQFLILLRSVRLIYI